MTCTSSAVKALVNPRAFLFWVTLCRLSILSVRSSRRCGVGTLAGPTAARFCAVSLVLAYALQRSRGRQTRRGSCRSIRFGEAGVRTDNAPLHNRRAHRHLPLRCARALRRVRRWAARRGGDEGARADAKCSSSPIGKYGSRADKRFLGARFGLHASSGRL